MTGTASTTTQDNRCAIPKPLQEGTILAVSGGDQTVSSTTASNSQSNSKRGNHDNDDEEATASGSGRGGDTANHNKRPRIVLEEDESSSSSSTPSGIAAAEPISKSVVTPTSEEKAITATTTTTKATTTTTTNAVSNSADLATSGVATTAAPRATATTPATTTTTASATLDLAETLELKVGTQIEVQWEIHKTDDDENNISNNNNNNELNDTATGASSSSSSTSLHWWRATLLEHDGRTTDSVAIRTLLYEARPDLGFPEPSREDVVFLGKDVLATSTNADAATWETDPDSVDTMPYRRVLPTAGTGGPSADASDVVHFFDDDQLEEQLNGVLMGALTKNKRAWDSMPASRKAVIAETIRKKKDQLKEILKAEARQTGGVITPETIKDILARAF